MKKKDFELIASILQETKNIIYNEDLYIDICENFSLTLSSKYPKFQKDKFLQACGIEQKKCINCGNNLNTDKKVCIGCRDKRCVACCKNR